MAVYTNCISYDYNRGHAFLGSGNSGARTYITISNPLGVQANVNSVSMKFGTGDGTFTQYGSATGYGNPITVYLVGVDDGVYYGSLTTSTVVYPNSDGYPNYTNLGDDVYTFNTPGLQLTPYGAKSFTFIWDDSWGNALIWSANASEGTHYNGYSQVDISEAIVNITITYDANYTGGSTSTDTKTPGTSYALPGDTFTRSGYKLIGWNTAGDGSGTPHMPVGYNYTVPNSNTTLFAIWYENFNWIDASDADIVAGNPTTKALASKFNELQNKIHDYVDSTFTPTTVNASNPMTATVFNTASAKLGMSAVTSGSVISASNSFQAIKTALNNQATYL